MNISKITNVNFGKFESWEKWNNVTLYPRDESIMEDMQTAIDSYEGRTIKVFGNIGYPNPAKPNVKYVRLTTYPLHEDIDIIRQSHPNARSADYKRHSKWMPLYHPSTIQNALEYVHKQNGYIRYCKNHPDHELARPSLGTPKF